MSAPPEESQQVESLSPSGAETDEGTEVQKRVVAAAAPVDEPADEGDEPAAAAAPKKLEATAKGKAAAKAAPKGLIRPGRDLRGDLRAEKVARMEVQKAFQHLRNDADSRTLQWGNAAAKSMRDAIFDTEGEVFSQEATKRSADLENPDTVEIFTKIEGIITVFATIGSDDCELQHFSRLTSVVTRHCHVVRRYAL